MHRPSPIIFLIILLLVEWYSYKGLSSVLSTYMPRKSLWIRAVYIVLSVLVIIVVGEGVYGYKVLLSENSSWIPIVFGAFVVTYMSKFLFALTHLIDDVVYVVRWAFGKIFIKSKYNSSRRHFITTLGLGATAMLFGGLLYGIFRGKFNFRVMEEDIVSDKIPKAFDGCRIVQISDLHLGSFINEYEPVEKAIEMINSLTPDYVVFTGDMVNNNAQEAVSWIDVFKKIKAKKGKYSIFGNHDYADYGPQSDTQKIESIQLLKEIHAKMGFKLLEDEHVLLEQGNESIHLIGVHNWGAGFHQIGDLDKALVGVDEDKFKILLSHDPTHFDKKVKGKTNIDLTLSGHTHGAQMGIEIPDWGIKWSPIKYKYPKWGGLYEEEGQKLYVNRGFGVLAYPGRLGVPPEITLLTLRSSKA